MSRDDKITVIVTVYNAEKYLKQCISSICSQSYNNLEIILINDGSTDGSLEICEDFAADDNRIMIVSIPNAGVVNARKEGIKRASGKYVSLIDADDWLEPNMFEKLYTTLVEKNVSVVMCGRYEESEDSTHAVRHGIPAGVYRIGHNLDFFKNNLICLEGTFFDWGVFPSYWDKLFITEDIRPYLNNVDTRICMGNDGAGVYPYLCNINSACILDDCLYHYRQVETSLVHTHANDSKLAVGFSVLYNFLNNINITNDDKYKITCQWHTYTFFLMIPRLYIIIEKKGKERNLLPFENIEKGSKVCIYGMGVYGCRLYEYLTESGYAEVVACIDRKYEELRSKGINAISIEMISGIEYDYLLIANTYEGVRKRMVTEALKHTDVSKIKEPKLEQMINSQIVKKITKICD